MSILLNYLKNKISFGKGIIKVLHCNKSNNQNIINNNIIYKEIIKLDCNNTSLLYPYGNFSTINYSLISKEIKPFQIISNNDILNITKTNNENIEIIYFGKKVEFNNIITYEIKDDSKVLYLVYTNNNIKKIIFYVL